MENNQLPTEEESAENFAKFNDDIEMKFWHPAPEGVSRYVCGIDPYITEGNEPVVYLTAGEVIRRFEDYLTPEEKAMLEAHREHYKKMSNR